MNRLRLLLIRLRRNRFAFAGVIGALVFGASGSAHPAGKNPTTDEVGAARRALQDRVTRVRVALQEQQRQVTTTGTGSEVAQWSNVNWNNSSFNDFPDQTEPWWNQ